MATMEDFLSTQQQIVDAIEQLFTNFKKDGADRKTPSYIRRRLETLDGYWHEFQTNHDSLCRLGVTSHEYFTANQYDIVKERFSNIRSAIQNYQVREESRPSTPILKPPTLLSGAGPSQPLPSISRGINSKTDEMMKKQMSNFRAFQRTVSNINLQSVAEKWEFDDLLHTLQTRWSVIDTLHWELDSELEGANKEYEDMYSSYEQIYTDMKKSINKKLWSTSFTKKTTPQMEIPTFSGSYRQWTSFRDLFTETIHKNPSLSGAQKMQFLKGKAERLIQHLAISTDNYSVCWEILNQRYNNKKLLFTSQASTLLNIPASPKLSVNHIKRIHSTTNECLNAIKNLGIDVRSWDPLLIFILSQKLDPETHTEYLQSLKDPRELPILKEFLDFLESKFITLETSARKADVKSYQNSNLNQISSFPNKQQKPQYQKSSYSTSSRTETMSDSNIGAQQPKYKCPICETSDHGIFYCEKFLAMSPDEKKRAVRKYNLCNNCLYNHHNKACISEKRCRTCNGNHNTILHEAYTRSNASPAASTSKTANTSENWRGHWNSHASLQGQAQEVLLPTALIMVQCADGNFIKMRALLDQGSQTSLITENAAQLLDLPRQKVKGIVSGVGSKNSSCTGAISINFQSIYNNNITYQTDMIIMQSLINNLPNITFNKPTWSCLDNIQLADSEFYISRPVDILLGGEIYSEIISKGICKSETFPTAQQTSLGWILCGKAVKTLQCNVVLTNTKDISKFWEIEDICQDESTTYSTEDQACIEFYKNTTKRRQDGKYEVRLPLKPIFSENLGNSKSKAIAQFKQLERKFTQQKEITREYKLFMQEYLSLGHMRLASKNCEIDNNYYLPHHCVHKADSTTTKYRVVFNASSKTTSGYSLNDLMYRGPNLQKDLQTLIIVWRQFKYGFTADIEKMFRMIWVNECDQDLQRIIWRDHPRDSLQEYRLTTVTYGTKAAPFLAMMTLRQLAQDEKPNYPNSSAINILLNSCYVDDVLYGVQQKDSGKRIQRELIQILQSGGFNLRKWKSNAPELLEDVDTDDKNQKGYDFKHMESTKTLGLSWNPHHDTFSFQYSIEAISAKSTKRALLSNISKLFDPLGWISPVTTKLKILFQRVWNSNLQWDDILPDDIHREWIKIREDLVNINQYHIERWIRTTENDHIELHGFCDASTKAYACVVYCKINKENNKSVTLMAAKARLVPTSKPISLPRLELCGAVLLSRLVAKLIQSLQNYNITAYCWTDSMVVLGWLKGDVTRWNTFVANRVSHITQIISAEQWYYVKSEDNPADCASRGLLPSQLKDHSLWWRGPTWLLQSVIPKNSSTLQYTTDQEVKKKIKVNVVTKQDSDSVINRLIERCSSYMKVVRVLAIILRFLHKNQSKGLFLSLQELHKSKLLLIKHIQQQAFSEEIIALNKTNKIKASSKILNLNPFIDDEGILRVGGRLRKAHISEEMKHPIILPNNTRLTQLIIDYGHETTLHGGPKLTSAFLRRRFWILGGNRAIKKQLRLCVTCRRHNPDKRYQLMGDLPEARINRSRPFYNTGVDYTGFIDIKSNTGRGVRTTKGYVALFVCMATKAVHLELVSDLTTSTFLAALRRMAARRGTPRHIYSDNGTNFIGANHVLQQQFQDMQEQAIPGITAMEIEWHFNAPSWPSAGGLCEAGVKSLKYHMRRVIGDQKLTYEELSTILSQIEAWLNSRPLCPMSEDPEDLDVLTPSHFLASGPNLTIYESETNLPIRWQLAQKIYHDIWVRWQSEYLSQLNARSKWKQAQREIKINDIVLINDLNLPPGKWSMGRVTKLHPGQDGHVRVVTLKTKNGVIKRPIVKLCVLPVHENINHLDNQQQSDTTSKQSSKPIRKKYNFTTMAITFLLFFMTLFTTSQCSYQYINFPNNQSLYFDKINDMHLIREEWNLVVYFDMNPYWDGLKALSKNIEYLDTICNNINKVSHCEGILIQLRHGYQEIEHYNRVLSNQQNDARARYKRGLVNGVGYLANTLFGVLDDRFAEKYEQDIKTIKINQNHLANLWKNQTSIVEAEFNLLKRTETVMDKQHKSINQRLLVLQNSISNLKSAVQNCTIVTDFTLSALIANNLLLQLQNMQEELIETITDIYHGKFNVHTISPQQLQHEIDVISSHLPKDLSSPVDGMQFSEIYHLLKVRAKLSEHYLIFEVKIPLITRDTYEILKIIPIPHRVGSQMIEIVPVSQYVAINLNKDTLLSLTENDMNSCLQRSPKTVLCNFRKPIHNIKNDESYCRISQGTGTCQTINKPCINKWTEINKVNQYIYSCCELCRLRLLCPDQITALQLSHAGLFSIGQGCIVKSENFSIFGHQQGSSRMHILPEISAFEMAPINHIVNLSPTTNQQQSINISDMVLRQQELSNIKNQLDVMKQSTPIADEIRIHDVHHYVAIYCTLCIVMVLGIAIAWRRLRGLFGRTLSSSEAPATSGPEEPAVLQPATSVACDSVTNECASVKCCKSVHSPRIDLSDGNGEDISKASNFKKDSATSPVFRSLHISDN